MPRFIKGTSPKFALGRISATAGVVRMLRLEEIHIALCRHVTGDWGELVEDDREQNEIALKERNRLLSVYYGETGVKFYIITEHDRSATTVLLPEDY